MDHTSPPKKNVGFGIRIFIGIYRYRTPKHRNLLGIYRYRTPKQRNFFGLLPDTDLKYRDFFSIPKYKIINFLQINQFPQIFKISQKNLIVKGK